MTRCYTLVSCNRAFFGVKCRRVYHFGHLTFSEFPGLKVKCFILKMVRNVITMISKEVLIINDVSNES